MGERKRKDTPSAVATALCERHEQWIEFGGFAPLTRAITRALQQAWERGFNEAVVRSSKARRPK